ncbi:MAG TPA: ATP synthase subunit I [Pyrinomonadaceae bacterium]|nr:ATP synthase subunit I [Pyrinomonadaceae bacterium]
MSELVDDAGASPTAGAGEDPSAMERRIFRGMCRAVALAVLISAPFAPWRVTTGLLLGGVLALLNHHWLRTSVAAVFGAAPAGARPKLRAARYVLRYVVIAAAVAAAYRLDLVSLAATLAGLCAFVAAALVEGFRQLYSAIAHREET